MVVCESQNDLCGAALPWKEGAALRVVLIYRKRREGAYSIEELFQIAGELGSRSWS